MTGVPRVLNRIHEVLAKTFDVEATIQRKVRTPDSAGGFVETWTDYETYPCSFSAYPIRDVERENAVRIQALSYWQFIFAFDADVQVTDRIVVGTRMFEVAGGGVGSLAISRRLLAVEIL